MCNDAKHQQITNETGNDGKVRKNKLCATHIQFYHKYTMFYLESAMGAHLSRQTTSAERLVVSDRFYCIMKIALRSSVCMLRRRGKRESLPPDSGMDMGNWEQQIGI